MFREMWPQLKKSKENNLLLKVQEKLLQHKYKNHKTANKTILILSK